jgi:hypothetical protein
VYRLADLIVAKFPKAHVELVECLGKISWDRYQRMQQEREINANIPGGTAASAQKSSGTGSEFRDSALGPSLPSVSATGYAETVISFMTGITEGKRVHFPPLPSAAKTGAQFECNACGRHIRAVNNREWRYDESSTFMLCPLTCAENTSISISNLIHASMLVVYSALSHLRIDSFGATTSNSITGLAHPGRV